MAKKAVTAKALGSTVRAIKNGTEREFTRQTWDLLSEGKQGWEELKGKPAELDQTDGGSQEPAAPTKPAASKATPQAKTGEAIVKPLSGAAKAAADKAAKKLADAAKGKEEPAAPTKPAESSANPDDVAANLANNEEGAQ